MTKLMVTANRLIDGRVVYLRADRSWTERCSEGWLGDEASFVDELIAWAKMQSEVVVEPYRIDVQVDGTRIRHASAREQIRAEGPAGVLRRYGPVRPPLRAAVG